MRVLRFASLLAVVFLAGCGDSEEEETIEVPVGYQGEARVNPYLAAERFLNMSGYSAESSRIWSDYGYETGVIVMPASFLSSKGMGQRASEWISDGGTMVLTLQGGEPEFDDFGYGSFSEVFDLESYPGAKLLLEEAKIDVTSENWGQVGDDQLVERSHLSRPWHLAKIDDDEESFQVELEGDLSLETKFGQEMEFNPDRGARLVWAPIGYGEIFVLTHARPFRNAYLDRADNAALLESLVEYGRTDQVVFLYGSSTSFFSLLWIHGWKIVIAGSLLLVFWLWMRIPRFGPVLEDPHNKAKPYGTELTAAARFLWRKNKIDSYFRPLRSRLEQDNDSDPETLYQRLAEQSGLERNEVSEALQGDSPKDPAAILQLVRKFQALLKS